MPWNCLIHVSRHRLTQCSFDSDIDHDKLIDYESKTYVTNIRETSGILISN